MLINTNLVALLQYMYRWLIVLRLQGICPIKVSIDWTTNSSLKLDCSKIDLLSMYINKNALLHWTLVKFNLKGEKIQVLRKAISFKRCFVVISRNLLLQKPKKKKFRTYLIQYNPLIVFPIQNVLKCDVNKIQIQLN